MKIATLFSGIGSPEQGAKRVYGDDLEMVFACEYDKFARESFEANYDIAAGHFHKDVHDLDGTKYRDKVDILIGGSPCQAFSIAGLREGTEDERGQLIYQYIRVVEECMPPVIVYENVKGMMSITGGRTIKEFVQALRDIGYYCHYEVINTKDYGVPQNRERLFLVGFLDHEAYHRFEYAPKVKLEKRLKDVLEDDVDEKYYLSDTAQIRLSKSDRAIGFYSGEEKTSPCIIASYHKIPSDGCYIQVLSATKCGYETAVAGDAINVAHLGSATGRGRVGKQRSQALTTGGTMCIVKDDMRIRKLTPRECLRLQDFPDTFEIVVSDSQAYKQAGNSMSVNILEMIFNQIGRAEAGDITNTLMDFAI